MARSGYTVLTLSLFLVCVQCAPGINIQDNTSSGQRNISWMPKDKDNVNVESLYDITDFRDGPWEYEIDDHGNRYPQEFDNVDQSDDLKPEGYADYDEEMNTKNRESGENNNIPDNQSLEINFGLYLSENDKGKDAVNEIKPTTVVREEFCKRARDDNMHKNKTVDQINKNTTVQSNDKAMKGDQDDKNSDHKIKSSEQDKITATKANIAISTKTRNQIKDKDEDNTSKEQSYRKNDENLNSRSIQTTNLEINSGGDSDDSKTNDQSIYDNSSQHNKSTNSIKRVYDNDGDSVTEKNNKHNEGLVKNSKSPSISPNSLFNHTTTNNGNHLNTVDNNDNTNNDRDSEVSDDNQNNDPNYRDTGKVSGINPHIAAIMNEETNSDDKTDKNLDYINKVEDQNQADSNTPGPYYSQTENNSPPAYWETPDSDSHNSGKPIMPPEGGKQQRPSQYGQSDNDNDDDGVTEKINQQNEGLVQNSKSPTISPNSLFNHTTTNNGNHLNRSDNNDNTNNDRDSEVSDDNQNIDPNYRVKGKVSGINPRITALMNEETGSDEKTNKNLDNINKVEDQNKAKPITPRPYWTQNTEPNPHYSQTKKNTLACSETSDSESHNCRKLTVPPEREKKQRPYWEIILSELDDNNGRGSVGKRPKWASVNVKGHRNDNTENNGNRRTETRRKYDEKDFEGEDDENYSDSRESSNKDNNYKRFNNGETKNGGNYRGIYDNNHRNSKDRNRKVNNGYDKRRYNSNGKNKYNNQNQGKPYIHDSNDKSYDHKNKRNNGNSKDLDYQRDKSHNNNNQEYNRQKDYNRYRRPYYRKNNQDFYKNNKYNDSRSEYRRDSGSDHKHNGGYQGKGHNIDNSYSRGQNNYRNRNGHYHGTDKNNHNRDYRKDNKHSDCKHGCDKGNHGDSHNYRNDHTNDRYHKNQGDGKDYRSDRSNHKN